MKRKVIILYVSLIVVLIICLAPFKLFLLLGICLSLLFLGPVLFLFLNRLFIRTNYYQNSLHNVEKFVSNNAGVAIIPSHLDIVNLGSSQPKFAFDYSRVSIKGMNWGIAPQTLDYDFRVLMKYHCYLKQDAVVLIPICPFEMFAYKMSHRSNYKYYSFLPPYLIRNYSKWTSFLLRRLPVLTEKKNIVRFLKDVPKDNRLELDCNLMSDEELKKDAEKWIHSWEKEFNIKMENLVLSEYNKECIEKNIQILNKLLHFCVDNQYRPVLILLPVTEYLGEKISSTFREKHIKSYLEKANDLNVPLLNYFDDKRFTSSDLYINSFFFNIKGRLLFTEAVIAELKSRGIL